MNRRISAASAAAATLLLAGSASASGILVARFGGEHGHPTTENPTAIYYNPAGLALGHGTRIYLDGTFALRMASYERPPEAIDNPAPGGTGTPADAIEANSGKAELSNFVASPFAAVVTDFGVEGLGAGLAFYAPIGGAASWAKNEAYVGNEQYPGAEDGVARWWSMDGTIRSLYFTGAGAYRIAPAKLSIGVGVNVVISEASTIRARNSDGSDDMVLSSGGLQEGRSFVDAKSTDLALGAGLIWEPMEDFFVGASYQSQPGFGEIKLKGTLATALGQAPVGEPSDIELVQELPDVFRLGVRFVPMDKVQLRVFGEYARWSKFEKQCLLDAATENRKCLFNEDGTIDEEGGGAGVIQNIPRNWEDAFGVRAGGSYHLKPGVELYVGAGYDGNAVPDETLDPALMDMDKITASLGGRFRLMDGLFLSPTFTQVIYFERTIEPQPRDADGTRGGFQPPSRQPDAAGTYNQSVSVLNIGAEYVF